MKLAYLRHEYIASILSIYIQFKNVDFFLFYVEYKAPYLYMVDNSIILLL